MEDGEDLAAELDEFEYEVGVDYDIDPDNEDEDDIWLHTDFTLFC